MQQPVSPQRPPPELLRAAFRELHGRRLHGFTLLLTLGDRMQAVRLSSEALSAGAQRIPALRHPERAGAWLRAHVARRAQTASNASTASNAANASANASAHDRREALADLGLTEAAQAGLAVLDGTARAVLIAETVERFRALDVATIAGLRESQFDSTRATARRTYFQAATGAGATDPVRELTSVDTSLASEPPVRTLPAHSDLGALTRAGRLAYGLAAVTIAVSGAIIGASRLLPEVDPEPRPAADEGVLGGAGVPPATASPSASPTLTPSPVPTPSLETRILPTLPPPSP